MGGRRLGGGAEGTGCLEKQESWLGDWLSRVMQSLSELRWLTWQERCRLAQCVLRAAFITVPLCSEGEFVAFAKCPRFLSSGTPWSGSKARFCNIRGRREAPLSKKGWIEPCLFSGDGEGV